ncbi:MAG TPA: EAL domain-containing protein [Thermoanaerobaculia bacterium]
MSDPHPLHLVQSAPTEEPTELARLRAEIEARNGQEIAIAELGQAALTGVDPMILLGQACALVEMTLSVGHCRALEIAAGGRMLVRGAIGTNETFVNCQRDADEDESIAMVTLLGEGILTFGNLEHETRFKSSHLRQYHGVRAGAGVVIRTQYGPWGVLLIYAGDERTFAEYELGFLRSTANILGEAVARSRTEQALRNSEVRLRQLIASALDAVVTIDRTGNVLEWNPQAEATFGVSAREAIGRPLPAGIFEDAVLFSPDLPHRRLETFARRANGDRFPVELTIDVFGDNFTAFVRDISETRRTQHELEQREKRFRTIVEKSWSGVALLDAELRFSFTGSSTQYLIGYDDTELLGEPLLELIHPREREAARRTFEELLAKPSQESHGEIRFRHKNGSWVWLEGFSQNLLHEPSVGAIVLNYRDVTQRKETERQLEYHAYYDSLTSLPNRLLFRDRVVNAIANARRNRFGLAIMYLDLDHFKLVNDSLGHTFGDTLLAEVANRLRACLRASDTISRIGGDEFSILLNEVPNTESVAHVARKLLDAISEPLSIDGHDLIMTGSIGISFYPSDGDDVGTLLKCADAALYRAKELGRNQAQLFTPSMNERYVRRLALEQSLHHAIERDQLELYYQPIYDRARRRIVSLEALIRWRDPLRGLVNPSEFIQLAEETGLIVPIGDWVLKTACRQLSEWHAAGLTGLRVAVNISAVQFQQHALVAAVRDAVETTGIAPQLLQLEITESAAMQNVDLSMRVLRELKELGVTIAVDDFGTGMSSLIYLKDFPIDTVKIDKEFLRDVTTDETAAAIVTYVINLAHTLGLGVVAEGVETEEQYTFLKHYQCDLLQGYLFSRPLPADDVLPFMQNAVFRPKTLEVRRPDLPG